jgi:hypothetical protein
MLQSGYLSPIFIMLTKIDTWVPLAIVSGWLVALVSLDEHWVQVHMAREAVKWGGRVGRLESRSRGREGREDKEMGIGVRLKKLLFHVDTINRSVVLCYSFVQFTVICFANLVKHSWLETWKKNLDSLLMYEVLPNITDKR